MSPIESTGIMFGLLILLLLTGLPVAFCLGGVAVLASIWLWGANSLQVIVYSVFAIQSKYSLMCLPGFFFTGVIMQRAGIAEEMFNAAYKWLGHVKGGLAVGVVLICAVFAAIVGVSGAATVAMAVVAVPAMIKRNYNKELTLGTVMAGGALGLLIPPSGAFVMYGILADVSIGKLFAGGIIPGLILMSLFIVYILVRSHLQPGLAPAIPYEERGSWSERFSSLKGMFWPLFLVFLVMGLILMGLTTPTEASGVGALGALGVAAIHRRVNWEVLKSALLFSMRLFGLVMWIMVSAKAFSSIYLGLGVVQILQDYIGAIGISPFTLVILMVGSWIFLGFFLENAPILFITGPLYFPLAAELGIDLIWFGVLYVMCIETALLTPPIGFNLFYMKAICTAPDYEIKGITLTDLYRSVWPFVGLQVIGIALVLFFPQLALWISTTGLKV